VSIEARDGQHVGVGMIVSVKVVPLPAIKRFVAGITRLSNSSTR
jgi:hypothetical protein